MKAFDASNYSGHITREQAHCIKEQGYDLAIFNTYNREICRQQLEMCRDAGFRLMIYGQLETHNEGTQKIDEWLETATGFPVEMLWLACEDEDAEQLTEAQTVDWINGYVEAAIGKIPTGIYTRKAWWERQTGNSQAFAVWPLWDAHYDNEARLLPVDYGGWYDLPAIKQYSANVDLCGYHVDLNIHQIRLPNPEPTYPIQEAFANLRRAVDELERLIGQ